MTERHLLVVGPGGGSRAVIVDAPDEATVAQLAQALCAPADAGVRRAPTPRLFVGARRVDASATLTASGILQGAVVGLGQPVDEGGRGRPGPPNAESGLEVAVTGGLHAGRQAPLPLGGMVRVGRAADAQIGLADPEISRSHLLVRHEGTGESSRVVASDEGSRNGVGRAGVRLPGPTDVEVHEPLNVGSSLIEVRPAATPVDVLEPDPDGHGTLRFNRPPRIRPPLDAPELVLPTAPQKATARRIPVAAALAPLVLGAVLFAVIGPSPFLLFMLLSPLLLGLNAWSDRRHGRKDYKAKLAAYEAEMATVSTRLAALVVADEKARRYAFPDPAAVVAIATAPSARLWERRLGDDDHLRLRVGLADRPARVRVIGSDRSTAPPPPARDVPVVIDLAAAGVLGIAGNQSSRLAVANAVLGQILALHSPRDVRVVLIAGTDATTWSWLPWAPHTEPPSPIWDCRRSVATDRVQAEARLADLHHLIMQRLEAERERFGEHTVEGPHVVVVLDGARGLRHLRGLADILRDGPSVGVFSVCLDRDEMSLPEECRATVVADVDEGTRARVSRPGVEPVDEVLLDGLDEPLAGRLTRALAPVRDLGRSGGMQDLPATARFLDLAGMPDPDAGGVAARWSGGGRTTAALLGVGSGGAFTVDLRRDGPHALIAGTTGAGKSELLQTMVASLALANSPEALTFVLVDYKGGAAFKDCARLPHCAGLITDLDGNLVARALTSLDAELKRRERLLADAGAKDIDDLLAGGGRLARLAIVIDEFASLVEEVPDFVKGVVGIGMRGRSLGVHVVLATQRPGGAVTADLRANVNLRLCLRVADPMESTDVIDVPDAASIPRSLPGRALARTGAREVTAFQTARVGGRRPDMVGALRAGADVVITVRPATLAELGEPPEAPAGDDDAVSDPRGTDLAVLVDAISEASEQIGVERPAAPWLPPLPDFVVLADVTAMAEPPVPLAAPGPLSTVVGVADFPQRQARAPFVVDLGACGSLAVVGAGRRGRSSALRTITTGLVAAHDPSRLHVYGVDGGTRGLACLDALPHCGGVVPVDDLDRVERLMRMLSGIIEDRQRAADAGWPAVLVLIDGLQAVNTRFAERDGGWVIDAIDRLLREGPSVDVHVVLATDRTGFTSRIASTVHARLVLGQADRDDDALVGLNPRTVPAHRPPGRALWAADGTEVQFATVSADPSAEAQIAAIEAMAASLVRASRSDAPRRVDPLPDHVDLDELAAAAPASAGVDGASGSAILGMDGDGNPAVIDLAAAAPGFVVAGQPLSGRSTALASLVWSLPGRADGTWRVVVVTPRPSPLRELSTLEGVTVIDAGADLDEVLDQALDDAHAEASEGTVLVVDDAELIAEGRVTRTLERRIRTARDDGLVVLAAATTDDLLLQRYRGWLADLRRSRSGLLLAPSSSVDGEVFDLKLPRSTGGHWPAGRGLLVRRGRSSLVQVATAQPRDALHR